MKKIEGILKTKGFKNVCKILIEVLFICFMFIVISPNILNAELSDLDEIWNFSFASHIADGKIPYKDFNMIITPGVSLFASIFLKIFANELIVYRILTIIFSTLFMFLIYSILKKVKVNKLVAMLLLIISLKFITIIFRFDYNFMIIFIDLLMMLYEFKIYNKDDKISEDNQNNKKQVELKKELLIYNKKYDFIIGLLAGLGICTKQTIGLILAIACLLYKIILVKDKKGLKEYLKILRARLIGMLIPVVLLCMYFTFNNIWKDFIDYTILGINGFTNSISYKTLFDENMFYKITAVLVPITIIYMCINSLVSLFIRNKKILKNKDCTKYIEYSNNILILAAYSVCAFVLIYPIANKIHFAFANVPTLIAIVYIINSLLQKILRFVNKKTSDKFMYSLKVKFETVILTCLIIFAGLIFMSSFSKTKMIISKLVNYPQINHFKYIPPQGDDYYAYNNLIGQYILSKESEGYTVYMLAPDAMLYMMPIDHCNKNYDLCLKGNTGKYIEEDLIKDLDSKEKLIVLVYSDDIPENWQSYLNIKSYVKDNMHYLDDFNIYVSYEITK